MNKYNKEVVVDTMLREVENEYFYKPNSEEYYKVYYATRDFIVSYFKGIDRVVYLELLEGISNE